MSYTHTHSIARPPEVSLQSDLETLINGIFHQSLDAICNDLPPANGVSQQLMAVLIIDLSLPWFKGMLENLMWADEFSHRLFNLSAVLWNAWPWHLTSIQAVYINAIVLWSPHSVEGMRSSGKSRLLNSQWVFHNSTLTYCIYIATLSFHVVNAATWPLVFL